ncbi:MAG: hypothetical protein VW297_11915, partial [Paracoccaceae bacterium]
LSARTTDKKVAEERKWKIAAKIYAGFDEALGDIDPQIARDQAFRTKAIKLFAQHGVKSPQVTEGLKGDFFEPDDIIRLFHSSGITVPDDMIDLLSEETKLYLTHLPSMAEQSESDKAAEAIFGKEEFDPENIMEEMLEGLEYLMENPNVCIRTTPEHTFQSVISVSGETRSRSMPAMHQ